MSKSVVMINFFAVGLVSIALTGCVVDAQGRPVMNGAVFTGFIAPPVVAVAEPVQVDDGYEPMPNDEYILAAAPADVVFIGGDTYIWRVDPYGRRERFFYGHGDHRNEVFHRRDELHRVMGHNGGRLPERGGRNDNRFGAPNHQMEAARMSGRPGQPAAKPAGKPQPKKSGKPELK